MTAVEQLDPTTRPPILLTAKDRELLTALLGEGSTLDSETTRFLREELERADLAPEEASNRIAGLGCEVKFIDHEEERVLVRRLVLPHLIEDNDCISVLTPIGSALVGLGPGQSITCHHGGTRYALTVLELRRTR